MYQLYLKNDEWKIIKNKTLMIKEVSYRLHLDWTDTINIPASACSTYFNSWQ